MNQPTKHRRNHPAGHKRVIPPSPMDKYYNSQRELVDRLWAEGLLKPIYDEWRGNLPANDLTARVFRSSVVKGNV